MSTRFLLLPLFAIALAGCAPDREAPPASTTPIEAAVTPASVPPPEEPSMPTETDTSAPAAPAAASIAGAIREGNRPPPALRVCATPVTGGAASCIETAAGAREYRIDVAPGRYHLLGWASGGEVRLIAHASQIRCIQAPCPPDELIEVEVADGEHRDGVDLGAAYADIPAGWPQPP